MGSIYNLITSVIGVPDPSYACITYIIACLMLIVSCWALVKAAGWIFKI